VKTPKNHSPSPVIANDLFTRAMRRARKLAGSAVEATALAGGVALAGPGLIGCDLPMEQGVPGQDTAESWVHDEGQRNPEMVSYLDAYWSKCTNPNTRFGPGSCDIYLKLRVRPVAGANLDHKEVGVVYRDPFSGWEQTARGWYFTTWADGHEEWHVRVTMPATRDYFAFHAFYRDGAYDTYYDDNAGENHVVNNGPQSQIVQVQPWLGTVAVTGAGVSGTVRLRVADLDYDKQIQLVGTTDDWNTVLTLDMGAAGETNRWYWLQDVYGGELWAIDLELPGPTDRFEYAVVYRHGVVNEARVYEYWDNNGGANHRVDRVIVD
jgi:hypothetical protein